MENEKPNNAVQQKVAQLAARMADQFMPCGGENMILGYTAILVLERGIREDMPPKAVKLARDIAENIKAIVETEEKEWQEEKVTAAPVLPDWAAVDGALRDIRECEHALTELGVDRDRRIDSVKEEYSKMALPLQNRIKKLEGDVKAYADAHRAELTGKSRTLNFGTVGYRISSRLILPASKAAEAIATLKALGRKEFIKTTETLDRAALLRQPVELLNQIGAYIQQRDEFYYDVSGEEAEL